MGNISIVLDVLEILYLLAVFILTPVLLMINKKPFHWLLFGVYIVFLSILFILIPFELIATERTSFYPTLVAIFIGYILLFECTLVSFIVQTAKNYASKVLVMGGLIGLFFGGMFIYIVSRILGEAFILFDKLIIPMVMISIGWLIMWIIYIIKQKREGIKDTKRG